MVRSLALALALTAVAIAASAQDKEKTALTDVSGTWVMTVESHQMGLELEQKDGRIEGVMHVMGRRVLLVGEFVNRTLTLKGERPEDGIAHGADSKAGPIVATMLDDGTLEGELSTNKGRTRWTGERLKKP